MMYSIYMNSNAEIYKKNIYYYKKILVLKNLVKVYNNKYNSILDNVEYDKYDPSIICTY